MNFTALVILLEIDNILAGVFQKKIDVLDVSFGYDENTIEFEFNRAADFIHKRNIMFYFWGWLEVIIISIFSFILLVIVTFYPIFMLMLYIIFKPIQEQV